jgi:hypothetical protein
MSLTTGRVSTGIQQAVSLYQRSVAKDDTRMIKICATSSVAEMHAAGLKNGVRSVIVSNRSSVKKGSMTTMVPIMTNLTDSVLLKGGGCNAGGVKVFSHDLKRECWPLNFKPSRIEMYDGSTNPAEWLEVYQLTIGAAGGDSYVMANYLPVCLSSFARTWLLRLPAGSLRSCNH